MAGFRSWKTALGGIGMVLAGLSKGFTAGFDAEAVGMIIGGLGLIFAQDAGKITK